VLGPCSSSARERKRQRARPLHLGASACIGCAPARRPRRGAAKVKERVRHFCTNTNTNMTVESICAGKAAIFVRLYRGACLGSSRGHPLRDRSSEREPERIRHASAQRDRHTWGRDALAPRYRAPPRAPCASGYAPSPKPNVTDLRAICEATATSIACS